MPHPTLSRTGGQILADQLRLHGFDHAFCVPGESYLALLDALVDHQDAIALTVCRQEGGAAYMAEAYAKLTGRPGLCMVTRGPGASNAMVGIHLAQQDSTPMILLVGQVGRGMRQREAFQEVDLRGMFGTIAKWVADIDDAARIPELFAHAIHTATAGRPGPVVLGLPEDMLRSVAAVDDARPWQRPTHPHPAPHDVAAVHAMLSAAQRPFVIVGGGPWSARAKADMEAFAKANTLPVGVSFRCQDYVDNTLPIYAGDVGIGINPALAERIKSSDLLLVIGPRLGEMTTSGYTLIEVPTPRQPLIHVHADAEELGRVYTPTLGINAAPEAFVAHLRALPPIKVDWADWTAAAHADYCAWNTPGTMPGPVDLGVIVKHLRAALPPDAILTNGAGNYAIWHHRFGQWTTWRTQLAPGNGTMGYGTPAAVAAARVHPGRQVVALAGDGCFLMNGQELATAVHYALPIIVIVVNNGMYGTIRMHQERSYPGRVHGTGLTNPDFAALARAYGAFGARVERTEDFAEAFAAAQACGGPAVIELRPDPDVITPSARLGQM